MSIFAKAAAFARSPQGRRLMRQASSYAKSPEGRQKLQRVVETAKSRRGGGAAAKPKKPGRF
jgi:hypothetical protein